MAFANFRALLTQCYPPWNGAPITEKTLGSQHGKIFIVTGGSSGIGYELARILYGAGGKVYIITRSEKSANEAMAQIKSYYEAKDQTSNATAQRGSLEFIFMDLADLTTVKAAADKFIKHQGPDGKLDVLFNNAGVGGYPNAPPTKQGHEYHYGINVLGGLLFTQVLAPILAKTAKRSSPGSVRVIWAASMLVDLSPKTGIRDGYLENPASVTKYDELYSSSKVATWFVAYELAKHQTDGVIHIAGNPGSYLTNIWRTTPSWLYWSIRFLLRDPVHGAATNMFMAFSDEVTAEVAATGRYVINDGRWHPGQREDLLLALRSTQEGGSGRSSQCFEWCQEKIQAFAAPM